MDHGREASSNQAASMRYPIFAAMVMVTVLAGRAHAQNDVDPANKDPYKLMLEREANERKENEKAYNEQMKRLKAQSPTQTNSDPWKKVRPAADNSAAKR
jgi:hypothetical protein